MIKKIFKKIEIINYWFICLLISIYFSFLIGEFFYDSIYSPDFSKYKIYMDYFQGNNEKTYLEQNLSYFFIQSFIFSLQNEKLFDYNFNALLDSSIFMTNNFLYIIGLIGIYKMLLNFNFKKNDILISLTLLNFFPPVLGMRMIFKPEIFVFALIPWIIYSIELFIDTKNEKYLYISYFLSIYLFTIKPTSTAMCGLFLLIRYRDIFLKYGIKQILILFLFLMIIFTPLLIEDFDANGIFYFFHEPNDEYTERPDVTFLYNIDIFNIKEKPLKNYHADSLPGIILLDTFGDYFEVLWENDRSLFKFNKVNLGDNFFVNSYLRKYIGIALTLIFYFLTIFNLIKSKQFKDFYFLPFYGIITLLIVAYTGNFEKSTGDILKTTYYSFFLAITFCFLILKAINKLNKENKLFISFLFIFLNLFIFGFPKESNPEYFRYLETNNVAPFICNINQIFVPDRTTDCKNYELNICNFDKDDYTIERIRNENYSQSIKDKNTKLTTNDFKSEKTLQKNNLIIQVNDKEECINYIENGFNPIKKNFQINNFPIVNIAYVIIALLIIIYLFISKIRN